MSALKWMVLPVLAAAVPACGASPDDTGRAADAAAARATESALDIPRSERERSNPVPPDVGALERGRVLFDSQCSMCHGKRGDGKGEIASDGPSPADFTDPAVQAGRTDGEWYHIIAEGHGAMKGNPTLSPSERWCLVHYLRTLAPSG